MAPLSATIQREQILEKAELRQLQEAVELLQAAEAELSGVKLSTKNEIAERFAAALGKLEGSGGAISKIRAAQAYAHQIINEAGNGSRISNKNLQKRIGYANVYIERLDRHIEDIEKNLIIFLNEKKNKCQSESAFNPAEYVKAAIQAVTVLRNLASLAKRDIGLAVDIFGFEKGKKPFWNFW